MKTTRPLLALVLTTSLTLSGCAELGQIISDQPEPDVTVTTATTTTTTTTTVRPATERTITHVTAREVRWTGPDLPWRAGGSPVSSACAEGHLYREDGSGGKFDWIRPSTKSRDFKNIHSGYGVWSRVGEPRNGEPVRLVAVNRWDHGDRILIGTFRWVR